MAKDLLIRSAFLATNEKLPDRFLSVGEIDDHESNNFVFYLLEVRSPWLSSQKIKKAIVETFKRSLLKKSLDEENFEIILEEVNEALSQLASAGEDSWIGNLNAIIGFIAGPDICIAQTGKISGYIFRKGKISSLTDNSVLDKPHPLKAFSDITAGKLIADDKVILSNSDLFNYMSLDRVRRIAENQSATMVNLELSKNLKKNKISTINAITIETLKEDKASEETVSEIPEIIYLDQKDESALKKISKQLSPKTKIALGKSKVHLVTAGKFLHKHGKVLYHKSKKSWQEKYGPKTREILKKSAPAISSALSSAKKSIGPRINGLKEQNNYKKLKVKTKLYTNHTNTFLSQTSGIAVSSWLFLKNIFSRKESRRYLILILFLIFMMIGYVKLRANNNQKGEERKQQETVLYFDQAKESFDKAKEDLALGRNSDTTKLEEALSLSKKAEEVPATKDKATLLTKEIQASLDKITKTTRFYPSTSLNLGKSVTKLILVGTNFYGIESGKIYTSNTKEPEMKLIGSIGSANLIDMAYSDSENKIYIYTDQKKVIAFDIKTNTPSDLQVADSPAGWESAKAIATFSSNIYLLDSETGSIWKHAKSQDSYSKGSSYVDTKKVSLKDAVDFAIDGNVFILKSNGEVFKFSKGSKVDFTLKDIPKPNDKVSPTKIYTDADTNYLYILDKSQNRIVKFDKSGEFVIQYSIDSKTIDDFVVNDKLKKIWILSGQNVYELDQ